MTQTVSVKRLKYTSLLYLLFVGLGAWMIPLSIGSGILGAFGFDCMKRGEIYVHGWQALLLGIVGGPLCTLMFSITLSAFLFPGLLLFSFVRSSTLRYVAAPGGTPADRPTGQRRA